MTDSSAKKSFSFRYRSKEIAVVEASPFENDRLGREAFVGATAELLMAIREPFVIALNAPWGSGKTTTLRLLAPRLKTSGVTAIYFNAWEVDDATDPLVPLVAVLHDQLLTIKGYGEGVTHEKVGRLKKLGSAIAKRGAIAAVKTATGGLLDWADIEDGLSEAINDAADSVAEGLSGDLIDAFKRERRAADEFRRLLQETITYIDRTSIEVDDHPPLVLMIDELDRCRPTFAVAMLERIKHFFDVPGLVFVLAIDITQLKASTRKVYGAELDATEYLRRFVDLELQLPRARVGGMVDAMLSSCGADPFFAAREKYPAVRDDRAHVVQIIRTLAEHFDLSLRVVQRMVTRLMLVLRQTPVDRYLDPVVVVFLIFLRMRDERMLSAVVSGQVKANEVMQSLRSIGSGGESFFNSHAGMMIEAHLLFAHEGRHEYVKQFLARARTTDPKVQDAASARNKDVADRYEGVSRTYFERGRLDLEAIERRINLVSLDLADIR